MAGVFDADIQTAQELIALYGADCLWQKPAPMVETTPGYPEAGETPDPIPCKIAFFSSRDLGRGTEEFLAMLAGMDVPANQEIGLLAGGVSFTPEATDWIVRSGTNLAIKKIDRLAPNGTPILYYVTVAA